jgi:hypothetical protein
MSPAARPGQLMLSRRLDARRAELARAVHDRIAGPEFQAVHERIWCTPGPRWFGDRPGCLLSLPCVLRALAGGY